MWWFFNRVPSALGVKLEHFWVSFMPDASETRTLLITHYSNMYIWNNLHGNNCFWFLFVRKRGMSSCGHCWNYFPDILSHLSSYCNWLTRKSGATRHDSVQAYALCRGVWYKDTVLHYNDVIMSAMTSQTTSLTIVYSIVYSGADQRTHQSSASLAFVR